MELILVAQALHKLYDDYAGTARDAIMCYNEVSGQLEPFSLSAHGCQAVGKQNVPR
jgi:hypothetical protein